MVKRRAFTLIELLVVIAVLISLSAMILALFPILKRSAQIAKTRTILSVIINGLESSASASARNLSPIEHPLAGTAVPRCKYVRASSGAATVLSASEEALTVARLEAVPAAADRVAAPDDLFADTRLPQLFGLRRREITVFGVACSLFTRYRALPDPGVGLTLPAPYTAATYPDNKYLILPRLMGYDYDGFVLKEGDPMTLDYEKVAQKQMITTMAAAADQLASLGAVYTPDPDRDPLIWNGRARQDRDKKVAASKPRWDIGRLKDAGSWIRYRLRGPGFCDAWGTEILVQSNGEGGLRLVSAGPDGVFAIHPGRNGEIDSDVTSSAPALDDKIGSDDNVVAGGR